MNIFWGNRFKSGQDKSMGLEVIITNRFSSDTETSGVPRERTPHQNVIVSTFIECFCWYTWFYNLIYFKSEMKWAHLLLINQDWLRKGQRTVQLKNCWWSISKFSIVCVSYYIILSTVFIYSTDYPFIHYIPNLLLVFLVNLSKVGKD